MKLALATAVLFVSAGLLVPAQEASPTVIIEIHDDDQQTVTLLNTPVSPLAENAATTVAACDTSHLEITRAANQWQAICRHKLTRTGSLLSPSIKASYDFAALASQLSDAGAHSLTTCLYHTDWPESRLSVNLPRQSQSHLAAYCGAWPLPAPANAAMSVTLSAGYAPTAGRNLIAAALAYLIICLIARAVLPRKGFLGLHSAIAIWWVSCFVWAAVILRLDGLRLLSLTFGITGPWRWLLAGAIAAVPPVLLSLLFSLGQDPPLIRWFRRYALVSIAVSILVTAFLCGMPEASASQLAPYLCLIPVFAVLIRLTIRRPQMETQKDPELQKRLDALAGRSGLKRPPRIQLWEVPPGPNPGALAILAGSRRIFLSTRIPQLCSTQETEAILAHELGHFRQHRWFARSLYFSVFIAAALFALEVEPQRQAWAVLAAFTATMLMNAWRRWMEFNADRFSARLLGTGEPMASVLTKLDELNQTPLRGSWLRELLLSHPWSDKRLNRLKSFDQHLQPLQTTR